MNTLLTSYPGYWTSGGIPDDETAAEAVVFWLFNVRGGMWDVVGSLGAASDPDIDPHDELDEDSSGRKWLQNGLQSPVPG